MVFFEGLRGVDMSPSEEQAFIDAFGAYSNDELESLKGSIQDLLMKSNKPRFVKVADVIRATAAFSPTPVVDRKRRLDSSEAQELAHRVTDKLTEIHRTSRLVLPDITLNPLHLNIGIQPPPHMRRTGGLPAPLDRVWFRFQRTGFQELFVLPSIFGTWMVRFHNPLERGWTPPGCSLRYNSLIEACSSKDLKTFWNGVAEGVIAPATEVVPHTDPSGKARARQRVEDMLLAGTISSSDL